MITKDALMLETIFDKYEKEGDDFVFHKYSAKGFLTTDNQTLKLSVKNGAWNFFVADINIHLYDKNANLLGFGVVARDHFGVQMSNASLGESYFDNAIDVTEFSPLNDVKSIPPQFVVGKNVAIDFEVTRFQHVDNSISGDVLIQVVMTGYLDKRPSDKKRKY
jgi:hypothetical protein